MKNKISLIARFLGVICIGLLWMIEPTRKHAELPYVYVERKGFSVTVRATGELETAHSIAIASSLRGDLAKLMYLAAEGIDVQPGEVLIRLDPSPFEEKIGKIKIQIKEQEGQIESLEKTFQWEVTQSNHEIKVAEFEVESAKLELDKLIKGDGPLEIAKLKNVMQKAWMKYEEIQGYSSELDMLEQGGFLHPSEVHQAQKKLEEESESYQNARMQYESYIDHVYPMLVKKAEAHLKKSELNLEEKNKSAAYRREKAQVALNQARQFLYDQDFHLKEAEKELAYTEIKAPSSGMVVHREEFRMGQRRKPRVGDVLIKNQPLLDLPDLDSMIVKAKVREVDLFKVGVGKLATVQVDAYPDMVFSGKVVGIGVLAVSDHAAAHEEKVFEIRVSLDSPGKQLRPGMTARVMIHAFEVSEGNVIPIHAIFQENNVRHCYVSTLFGYKKQPVQIGRTNEYYAEILNGLNKGDCVYLVNPFRIEKL
jgi:HlyD family secretion protein